MKMNLPNRLTVLRMLLVPVLVVIYLTSWIPEPISGWILVVLFIGACVTDAVDGNIARKRGLVTDFGKLMDPLADKLLVCSLLICMCEKNVIPAWCVVILIGREFIISGFRLIACEKGVVIAAGILGKVKTVVQMIGIGCLLSPIDWWWFKLISLILIYVSVLLSIGSLIEYIGKNIGILKTGDM